MNDPEDAPKIFLVDTISTEGLFGLFSIFFISTICLYVAGMLMTPAYQTYQYQQSLLLITVSSFLIGYTTVLVAIIIYYIIRFSKFFKKLYERYQKIFVIAILLFVIIVPSVVASIYTTSSESSNRMIAFSVLTIMGIILIMMQKIFVEMAEPITSKISKIISKK